MPARSFLRWLIAPSIAAWCFADIDPVAAAEPPTGANFDIWYYKTNADGERENARQFSSQDLTQYVNRARCECGQDISTKILLKRAMTSYDNSVLVRTYVGSRCDQALNTPGLGQAKPCARVLVSTPSDYTHAINFGFEPIWLVAGIADGSSPDINDAVPSGSCESGQGDGGIWICIENGTAPDCQADEFQVQGTQNKNSAMGMAQAIHYDFSPPTVLPTDFTIEEGDGAIRIEWRQDATGDGNGFRVLCADENGQPLPGHGVDNPPSLTAVSQGTIYFTPGNLCPGGPFANDNDDLPDGVSTEGGSVDGTDGGTGDSTGGDTGGTSVGLDDLETWQEGVFATGSTGGSSSGAATGDSGTGTGTGSGTGSTGTGGDELPATGIESLDWDYVCTGHLSATAKSARIEGLENDRTYQFLVVAYDAAGNPAIASDLLTASPRETVDLWEQCEAQGNVCGDGGFCNCSTAPRGADALGLFGLAGVGLVGWMRRRRRG